MKWLGWVLIFLIFFHGHGFSDEKAAPKKKYSFSLKKPPSALLKKNFFFFLSKKVWVKPKRPPKMFSFERINEAKNRLEKTGSGMIAKWKLGRGFKLFTLTSAKYRKKLESLKAIDQERAKSETNGKMNFGLNWSFLKEKNFALDSYASFNFKYWIENQILMQRMYSLSQDPFGRFSFDGISLTLNLRF